MPNKGVIELIVWMLRKIMAERGVWTGAALARLLKEKANYSLSAPSISALIKEQPKQVKADTLDALCTALVCTPNDLWVFTLDTSCVSSSRACLSFPDYSGNVKRANYVKISTLNRKGGIVELEAEGFMARCIQHEMDHLNGNLFIDYVNDPYLIHEQTKHKVSLMDVIRLSKP
jgi:putative transcriptional regulator